MRRYSWLVLVLVLAGCGGPDSDPIDVAERFHAHRLAGDDRGIHALLSDADRAAVPLDVFPLGLPPRLELKLLGWGSAALDSASLLGRTGDTAEVVVHVGPARDTLRLVATHHPRKLLFFELDRLRWRVSAGLAGGVLLDSLAAAMRDHEGTSSADATGPAGAYVQAAERYPDLARPADLAFARSALRQAAVAEALRVELKVAPSFTGTMYVTGQVENPTGNRIATLRFMVEDVTGRREKLELWEVPARSTTPVMQLTGLQRGPVTFRLDRIQVF